MKMERQSKSKFFDDTFKNITILSLSNGVAYVLGLLILPLITSHFSPEDFGKLSLIVSYAWILSSISTAKIELSIPNTNNAEERDKRFIISFLVLIFSTISTGLILFSLIYFYELDNNLMFIVPISFFLALTNLLTFFWIKEKDFALISISKTLQSISNSVVQLIGFFLQFSYKFLIYAFLIQFVIGTLVLFKRHIFKLVTNIKKIKLKDEIYKIRDYVKYSSFEGIFKMTADQAPTIIIATFNPIFAGKLFLSNRIAQIPMNIFAKSIAQTFAADIFSSKGKKEGFKLLFNNIKKASFFLGLPFLLLMVVSNYFELFLGEEWLGTGNIIFWLCIFYFIQSMATNTGSIYYAYGKNHYAMYISLYGLLVRTIPLTLVISYDLGNQFLLYTYIITGILHYLPYFFMQIFILNTYDK